MITLVGPLGPRLYLQPQTGVPDAQNTDPLLIMQKDHVQIGESNFMPALWEVVGGEEEELLA